MKIILNRLWKYPSYTISRVDVNGTFFCYALEDTDRGLHVDMPKRYFDDIKVLGETAIPTGTYEVIIDFSKKFQKWMPHVLWRNKNDKLVEVPGFSGIRIHKGNTAKDTMGCILIGDWEGGSCLVRSKPYTDNLYDKIWKARNKNEKVVLEIH